jgi:DNA-binding NtrC family response regulator
VVHGIVAAHHGAVTVDSALGRGSTFHIYFPLADSQSMAAASGWGALQVERCQGQGQHVLYVDDDEAMGLLVERLLQRLGYRVTRCQDPRQAVVAVNAQSQTFDLVVSAFNMPELSGLDVARVVGRIRADLPVVIISGHFTEEQRAEMLRAGVRELLRKENTFEELGALVHRLLQPTST